MNRVLEPEVMDDPAQADAYAHADFASVNQSFVDRFLSCFSDLSRGAVVDLGCGPADIPNRLLAARPEVDCYGVDASVAMLRHARGGRATPIAARLGALPFRDGCFDAVVSNSLLHHLPAPAIFWTELARLGRAGARVLVMDLHRPESAEAARSIVDTYAAGEPEILRRDFFHSLLAAFTVDEVRAQLGACGLRLATEVASDRHWVAWGRLDR